MINIATFMPNAQELRTLLSGQSSCSTFLNRVKLHTSCEITGQLIIIAGLPSRSYFIVADIQIMVLGIEGNSSDPLIISFG